MRKSFPGYYKPSQAELQEVWKDCLIVLDANVMLNLYRYTEATRETLLKVIELHADKIWIPHQVALEYHFNRDSVIDQQYKAYDLVSEIIAAIPNQIAGGLGKFSKHPTINTKKIIMDITEITEKISGEIIGQKKGHPNLLNDDSLGHKLSNVLQDKVGEPFTQDKLNGIYSEGATRYERKIPPGYKDNPKQEKRYFRDCEIESRYGDLIVWKQILEKANEVKKPIILVTDDTKEDWWQRQGGMTLGPRPELVDEMMVTTGNKFYMYQTDMFIEVAEKQLDEGSSQAIEEVRAMREFDLSYQEESNLAKQRYNVSIHKLLEDFPEEQIRSIESENDVVRNVNRRENSFSEVIATLNRMREMDDRINTLNLVNIKMLAEAKASADENYAKSLMARIELNNEEIKDLMIIRQHLRIQLANLNEEIRSE